MIQRRYNRLKPGLLFDERFDDCNRKSKSVSSSMIRVSPMAPFVFSIALFASALGVSGQPPATANGDSLTVRQANIANNPFGFGNNPLRFLLRTMREKPTGVKRTPVENVHVDNKMDTTYDIRYGEDKFTIYRWDAGNGLVSAHLKSSRFTTRFGIRAGMKKSDVIRLLPSLNLETIPRILILEDPETPQRLVFSFKGNVISGIDYHGYID